MPSATTRSAGLTVPLGRAFAGGALDQHVRIPLDVDPDPEDIGSQGAHLLGKACDAAERAPGLKGRLQAGERLDPREGLAATTFYDQIKAFFTHCAGVRVHGVWQERLARHRPAVMDALRADAGRRAYRLMDARARVERIHHRRLAVA